MPKKRVLPAEEVVQVSLGVQLLDFAAAESMSNHTWAGAEEVLETVDLSKHPASAATLQILLDRGWESESITGLLLGIWMKKTANASDIAADLLALERAHRRALTALYSAGDRRTVVQYSVTREGTLMEHSYSRKALAGADIKIFPS